MVRPTVKRPQRPRRNPSLTQIRRRSHPASDTAVGDPLSGQTTPEASEALEVVWGVHVGQEGRVELELDDVELLVGAVERERTL